MFENQTLTQFNENLASKNPIPGGGSALAIVGTLACSLVEMSINITLPKLDDSDVVKSLLQNHIKFFARARARLFQLADEDSQAFRHILDCKKLPVADASREKLIREYEQQKAYHRATLVPLEVMRLCAEALNIAQVKVYPLLYKYVASDCKVGIDLFRNIIENSMENVYANTKLIADTALREMLENQGREIVITINK